MGSEHINVTSVSSHLVGGARVHDLVGDKGRLMAIVLE